MCRVCMGRLCYGPGFGIEGGIWDVIVLITDHCPSVYFAMS